MLFVWIFNWENKERQKRGNSHNDGCYVFLVSINFIPLIETNVEQPGVVLFMSIQGGKMNRQII